MKKQSIFLAVLLLSSSFSWAESHGHAPAAAPVVPLVNLEEEAKKYSGHATGHSSAAHAPVVKSHAKTSHKGHKGTHKAHWGYTGATGPAHWGDLDPKYISCKIGKNQSPIDIQDKKAVGTVGLPGLEVVYGKPELEIINNGHTVQVNYPIGNSYMKVGGHRFELLQFHFHTPSEHQLNGFNYPMEMHLVHKDNEGNLAVLGIIYKQGAPNPELQKIIDHLPKDVGKKHRHKKVHIDLRGFFPKDTRFYKYSGSLTTPPCSEGVYWMVFKQPIEASAEQLEAMEKILGANNRPVQPHYSRHVLKSWAEMDQQDQPFYYY